jgi:hypothetical protein
MSFQMAYPDGPSPGGVGRIVTRPLAAAQVFNVGALLLVDANGAFAECAANPAAIAAVALAPAGTDASGFNMLGAFPFPPGQMQGEAIKGRKFTCKYVGTLPAADGALYGVVRDSDNSWKVNFADTVNTRVKLVDRRTNSPENIARVVVEFLDANVQSI